jgi:hypothetical protein
MLRCKTTFSTASLAFKSLLVTPGGSRGAVVFSDAVVASYVASCCYWKVDSAEFEVASES